MERLVFQEWLSGIRHHDHLHREFREELPEQVTAGQVLYTLVGMGDATMYGHLFQEEFGRLFYLPDPESRGLVNILLIKQGHRYNGDVRISGIQNPPLEAAKYDIIRQAHPGRDGKGHH
jgi:hypothetical protein